MPESTPIATLHDATRHLQSIGAEIQRIAEAARPLAAAHFASENDAGAIMGGAIYLDQATSDALRAESGWGAFYTTLDGIADGVSDLVHGFEQMQTDAHHALEDGAP